MRITTTSLWIFVMLTALGVRDAWHAVLTAQMPAARAPMPIDVAFARKAIARTDRLALSSDGALVAYVVRTPPAKSAPDYRFLPNGIPSSVIGSRVFVTDVTSGAARQVASDGGNCWRPWWAPDSTHLALYCDAGGFPQLWVYDAEKNTSRRLADVRVKAKLWAGDEAHWSPDSQTIFVPLAPTQQADSLPAPKQIDTDAGVHVTVHRAGAEASNAAVPAAAQDFMQFYMRENNAALGAIDVTTGAVRIVASATANPPPSVLRVSPSGKWIAYLSVFHKPRALDTKSFNDLAVVPSAGGTVQSIAPDIPVIEGDYYLSTYIWHPTRDQLFWVKDKQLWMADLAGSAPTSRRLAAELGDFAIAPLAVTRDGGALVAGIKPLDLHDYRDPYPQALAFIPLDGHAAKTLALPDGMVFQGLVKQDDSTTVWQPEPHTVTVMARESATTQDALIRMDLQSDRTSVIWKGLARVRFAGAPADHRFIVAAYEDLNSVGNIYRFDARFSGRQRLSDVEPRLNDVRYGPAEAFETLVPQFDGTTTKVTTAVLLPAGAKRGDRLPALVFLYPGGKVSRTAAEFGGGMPSTVPVSVFTTRGYVVLLAELPIGPDGAAGNPRPEMVEVLLPQVYHAAELGYINLNRVAVSGQSYGGYGTASIVTGTNLFRAAIAISGIYDLPSLHSWMDRNGTNGMARWAETGQGRMGTHPWADLRRYLTNSPFYQADRVHTPLLMLHGAADPTCPIEDARKMFNALKRLERTVQLAEYAGEGHVVYDWSLANAVDAATRMLEFLNKYLRPGSTSD